MSKRINDTSKVSAAPGNNVPQGALLSPEHKSIKGFSFDGHSSYVLEDDSFVFDPVKTFECGQCFRFNMAQDGSYSGVIDGKLVSVRGCDGFAEVTVKGGPCDESFCDHLDNFFDLGTDYKALSEILSEKDGIMKSAVTASSGIRLLRQDFFETVISFIVSANNNIPRIKKCIENICCNYGKSIIDGSYSFPDIESLASASPDDLTAICRVGYRGPYIAGTAKMFAEGKVDFDQLINTDAQTRKKIISSLPGVGPKVLSCIMLFSGLDRGAFPVDVWVERMMQELYGLDSVDRLKLEAYGKDYFGENAGLAQQYLFYYIRQLHGK